MSLLTKVLFARLLEPRTAALLVGVSASSYFVFGNLGSEAFGVPSLLERKSDSSVWQRVALFAWFYERAKHHMASSIVTSSLAFTAAAILSPTRPSVPSPRPFLIPAIVLSTLVPIFTLRVMMPINLRLLALDKTGRARAGTISTEETARAESEAEALFRRWRQLHWIRIVLGEAVWALGMLSLIIVL